MVSILLVKSTLFGQLSEGLLSLPRDDEWRLLSFDKLEEFLDMFLSICEYVLDVNEMDN